MGKTKETADKDVLELEWIASDKDYCVALDGTKIVCRNPKGKVLASVPKWLKDGEAAQQLNALSDWLNEHERECASSVEAWMLRSLPVPRSVLVNVWPDPSWSRILQNLVVAALDKSGEIQQDNAGFLREVHEKKGVGIVDLDGETQWLKSESIMIPHPILLDEKDDFRELSAELDFTQSLDQLFRETWESTEEHQGKSSIEDYSNGKFEQLNHVLGLCRRLGYRVRGGSATCSVWESGQMVDARYWVGAEYPEEETWTGELVFVDHKERPIKISQVGPVAFSEGMRMAAAIYAKRVVKEDDDED